jgi:hypothetical protein
VAAKKKSKQTKSKRTVKKSEVTQMKKAARKKLTKKNVTAKKKPAKKKASPKKAAVKLKTGVRKISSRKSTRARNKPARGKNPNVETVVFSPAGLGAQSAGQSGDLQGLSNIVGADSESVDELIEEGNAFEAEVVKGVEDTPDADQGPIRTHEVPEDDVPSEYDEQ